MIILLKYGHVIVLTVVVYVQFMSTGLIILQEKKIQLFYANLSFSFRTEYYRSEQVVTEDVNVTIYHCCLGWTRLTQDYGCPIGKNFFIKTKILMIYSTTRKLIIII